MEREDLTGKQFGKFIVLGYSHTSKHRVSYWRCQCTCEDKTVRIVQGGGLKSGHSYSCGCLKRGISKAGLAAYLADYQAGVRDSVLNKKYRMSPTLRMNTRKRGGMCRRPKERTHTINAHAFDEINEHSAYWLGMLLTDGCRSQASSPVLAFSQAIDDREHVLAFRRFMGSSHPIQIKPEKRIGKYWCRETASYQAACPPHLERRLTELGITPRKTFTAQAHDSLINNRHFWRGCIDGDGSVLLCQHVNGAIPIVSLVGSRMLLDQFSVFMRSVAPGCRANVTPHKRIWGVSTSGCYAIQLMRELYANCSVALKRKRITAKKILRLARQNPLWCHPSAGYRRWHGKSHIGLGA